jgi:hypothetical protein
VKIGYVQSKRLLHLIGEDVSSSKNLGSWPEPSKGKKYVGYIYVHGHDVAFTCPNLVGDLLE